MTNGSVFTKENATLIVTCDVVGGKPDVVAQISWNALLNVSLGWPGSSAIWLKDGKLFDDSYLLLPERISRNQMIYKNPTRGDHKSEFTCIGSNNNLTSKLTKTLTLYIKSKFVLQRVPSLGKKDLVCFSVATEHLHRDRGQTDIRAGAQVQVRHRRWISPRKNPLAAYGRVDQLHTRGDFGEGKKDVVANK